MIWGPDPACAKNTGDTSCAVNLGLFILFPGQIRGRDPTPGSPTPGAARRKGRPSAKPSKSAAV